MGESISTANLQQQAEAKAALSQMCESVSKAIIEVAKLEGPIQSEEVVTRAGNEVLKLCNTQAEQSMKQLSDIIKRERLGQAMRVVAGGRAPADLLFLELLRVALYDDDDDDDNDGPGTSSSSGSGSGAHQRPQRPQTARREISIAHPWTKQELLGKGAFGEVYSAVDKNGVKFAVKEVKKDTVQEKALREEVQHLGKLYHRNIVRFYGCAGDDEKIFMYMELMQGSVKDRMKRSGPISESMAKQYTKDILRGLMYLHGENIVHCDIKCANVLLTNDGTAKLADMGISRKHDHSTVLEMSGDVAGTLLWMSPEQLSGFQGGKRSDVWSVGCTVYEMVTGGPPFERDLPPILYVMVLPRMIENLEHRRLVQNNKDFTASLKEFLLKIFVKMDNRPFVEQIINHGWVASL